MSTEPRARSDVPTKSRNAAKWGSWRDVQRSFYAVLKTHPKLQYALYAAIVLIIALLYFGWPPLGKTAAPPEDVPESTQPETTASLETRLRETLARIEGVGAVEVLISYESSPEKVPAMSVDRQSETGTSGNERLNESSEPFTVSGEGADVPLMLMEIEPRVRGVIVVAEGANDLETRMRLQNAVQTALDIPVSKVEILPMATQGNDGA